MFDKEKVQNYINKYLNAAIQRYNITDPRNIESRKYLEIKSHLWHDMEMANLVPYHTGNPEKRKPGTEKIYMAVEQMIGRAFRNLGSQQTYGESFKKLGKKVVALHECSKRGMKKKGYAMFKEALQAVMMLEANGCKSEVLENAKAILTEYYDTYKTQIKKDTTRVIVESKTKAEEAAEKAEAKAKKEEKKQLKEIYKELTNNISHLKESIMEHDWASIDFRAQQIKKISDKIISMGSVHLSDTGDESAYLD